MDDRRATSTGARDPGVGVNLLVLPPVPALLPRYAGLTDPVADLRAACRAGVRALLASTPARVVVVGEDPRVAEHLLAEAGWAGVTSSGPPEPGDAVVVLANGSARRGEKAPGHLDPRAHAFDAAVEQALLAGDPDALAGLDLTPAGELLTAGLPGLVTTAGSRSAPVAVEDLYADDPFGVRYWVVLWRGAPEAAAGPPE